MPPWICTAWWVIHIAASEAVSLATAASVLKRPALVPVPAFGPRALLGRDLADALLFTGQRIVPRALEASGYRFAHPTLDAALRHLLAGIAGPLASLCLGQQYHVTC